MPLLSVLRAAFRWNLRLPKPVAEEEGGLLFCNKCGITYLVNHINLFASCETCGGPLTTENRLDGKKPARTRKEKRSWKGKKRRAKSNCHSEAI